MGSETKTMTKKQLADFKLLTPEQKHEIVQVRLKIRTWEKNPSMMTNEDKKQFIKEWKEKLSAWLRRGKTLLGLSTRQKARLNQLTEEQRDKVLDYRATIATWKAKGNLTDEQ